MHKPCEIAKVLEEIDPIQSGITGEELGLISHIPGLLVKICDCKPALHQ